MAEKDLVSRFVPDHNHSTLQITSLNDGHVHQYLNVSFPPTILNNGDHIHYSEGYVLFEDGHVHYYEAWSGPAIPTNNGMHVHAYDFYTTEDDGHRHRLTFVDNPGPGNE
jgi:YmaF family